MYLSYLKDVVGNNYMGVSYYLGLVEPYLNKMKEFIPEDYDEYIKLQHERDHGSYHMTVMSVMEYNNVIKRYGANIANGLSNDLSHDFDDIKYMGLGTASSSGNTAYFIICKSEQIQIFRSKYGLEEKDLHITIGFKWKDVFGVPKNEVLTEPNLFLNVLSDKYYSNNQSFSFIKDIINYDYELKSDIYPISIDDTQATFRIDKNDYISVALINDYLYVICKWKDEANKPYLANTIIDRKFKK